MSKAESKSAKNPVLEVLNKIFQNEMAAIIRYLHYSFMIMGPNRIPIQGWFRAQATEGMTHATLIGEKITSLGGHPPVVTARIEESNNHDVDQILRESLTFEQENLELYKKVALMSGDDIALEEMARSMVRLETEHVDEVRKMLRAK